MLFDIEACSSIQDEWAFVVFCADLYPWPFPLKGERGEDASASCSATIALLI